MVICTLFISFYAPFLRILEDGLERTFFHTKSALNAFILINRERRILITGDTLSRAALLTNAAAFAGIGIDDVFNHGFTYAGRTFLVDNVGDVFVTEIFHSG